MTDTMTEHQTTHQTNRAAADRLADVRQKIAELKAEEAALRQGFINGTLDPQGDDHMVVVETKTNERLDLKRMRETVDTSIWSPYLIQKQTAYVTLRKRQAP
jgi:hypothetical protein